MADKKKLPRITSAKGRFQYPRIIGKPDTKFDADGVWQTKFICNMDTKGVPEMLAAIDAAHEKAFAQFSEEKNGTKDGKGKKITVKQADKPYFVNEEDNTVTLGAKAKFKITKKSTGETWEKRVVVFGPDSKPLPDSTKLGSGSTGQIVVDLNPFYVAKDATAGVSLRLVAAKITNIVEYGADAGQYGFAADDEDDSPAAAAAEEDEDTDGSEDAAAGDDSDF